MYNEAINEVATMRNELLLGVKKSRTAGEEKKYRQGINARNQLLSRLAFHILTSSEERWLLQNRLDQLDGQVKSKERVANLAEVLTDEREVKAMIHLVDKAQYAKEIEFNPEAFYLSFQPLSTWLEPAVGDGNFIVVILSHKLARNAYDFLSSKQNKVKAEETLQYEIIKSLSSIYAVDIDRSNVNRSRDRLLRMIKVFYSELVGEIYKKSSKEIPNEIMNLAQNIVQRNIILGNTICDDDKELLNTHKMHLVEYSFNDKDKTISMRSFTYAELAKSEFTPPLGIRDNALQEITKAITSTSKVNKILREAKLKQLPNNWKTSSADTVLEEILGVHAAHKQLEKEVKKPKTIDYRKKSNKQKNIGSIDFDENSKPENTLF